MEYISAEEFLKQLKEIQEVFLDNINLEQGDLYKDTADYNSNLISLQSQEGYFIQITSTEFMGGIMKFSDLGTDLLKAYWQVACKIAYECSELKIKEELKALKHNIEVLENSIESCSEWEYYTEISDLLESDKERYNKLMKDYDFRENKIAKTLRVERMKNNGNKIYD